MSVNTSAGMPTFVLGLDIDGVLGDYLLELRSHIGRAKSIDPSLLPEPSSWSLVESGWADSPEEFLQLHTQAVRDGMLRSMPVFPGASEALWKLSDAGVYIRVVTHRFVSKGEHALTASDTVTWLDNHNIPYRGISFEGMKTDIGANVYIDDGPHNVTALRGIGKNVIVFDAPYNKELPGPRVHNWGEAYDVIADFARQAGLEI